MLRIAREQIRQCQRRIDLGNDAIDSRDLGLGVGNLLFQRYALLGLVALGLATFFGPNMIILDEPTNHLDIDSRAALAEAINEFPGAVIMVSHDRYLIESCADQLWVVADRTVTPFDGDLDDYRRLVLSARGMRTSPRDRGADERGNGRDKPQRSKTEKRVPLKQKISDAEAEIERINGIISKIDVALALPDLFQRDPKQAAQLSKARAGAALALQRAEEEWLTASSSYDEAAG